MRSTFQDNLDIAEAIALIPHTQDARKDVFVESDRNKVVIKERREGPNDRACSG